MVAFFLHLALNVLWAQSCLHNYMSLSDCSSSCVLSGQGYGTGIMGSAEACWTAHWRTVPGFALSTEHILSPSRCWKLYIHISCTGLDLHSVHHKMTDHSHNKNFPLRDKPIPACSWKIYTAESEEEAEDLLAVIGDSCHPASVTPTSALHNSAHHHYQSCVQHHWLTLLTSL